MKCNEAGPEIAARIAGEETPDVIEHLNACESCRNEEAALRRLHDAVAATLPLERPATTAEQLLTLTRPRPTIAHRYWYLPATAAAALLLFFAAFSLSVQPREQTAALSPSGETIMTNHVFTAFASSGTLTMPEKGTVRHGPGTSFAFLSPSSVHLSAGELFFNITPQASPFTVATQHARIRVIGTAFGVRVDPRGNTLIRVTRGAVKCFHLRRSLTLTAGETALVDASGPTLLLPEQRPKPTLRITLADPREPAFELAIENASLIPAVIPQIDDPATYLSINLMEPGGKNVQIKLDRSSMIVLERPIVAGGAALIDADSRYLLQCHMKGNMLTKRGTYAISAVYTNSDPVRGMWTGMEESNREEIRHE